jgi:hypothetical protein
LVITATSPCSAASNAYDRPAIPLPTTAKSTRARSSPRLAPPPPPPRLPPLVAVFTLPTPLARTVAVDTDVDATRRALSLARARTVDPSSSSSSDSPTPSSAGDRIAPRRVHRASPSPRARPARDRATRSRASPRVRALALAFAPPRAAMMSTRMRSTGGAAAIGPSARRRPLATLPDAPGRASRLLRRASDAPPRPRRRRDRARACDGASSSLHRGTRVPLQS